ncbi:hypothetical protein MBAV_005583 [Candidatus Magnetobacterium bavaricum]|uniref:Uncharacterized protein n=1 Tax=Candidatus Magnetobacterium bavaricum TaxID=29290 RepID=A0A0F3GNG1_9BACT|nr:hypothetical protein MBAV_005583 [Candidatus Magnetobacterium bavaricum]
METSPSSSLAVDLCFEPLSSFNLFSCSAKVSCRPRPWLAISLDISVSKRLTYISAPNPLPITGPQADLIALTICSANSASISSAISFIASGSFLPLMLCKAVRGLADNPLTVFIVFILYIISNSADRAPAAFMDCIIAIRSLGETPSLFKPDTISPRLVPEILDNDNLVVSFTLTPGCTDCPPMACRATSVGVASVISMVRSPWAMATGNSLTFSPITTVPVRSFMITFAGTSMPTSMASMSLTRPTTSPLYCSGTVTFTDEGSSVVA